MKHSEKIAAMRASHEQSLKKLAVHDPDKLPPGVNKEKLDEAHDKIAGEYVLVFKRKDTK